MLLPNRIPLASESIQQLETLRPPAAQTMQTPLSTTIIRTAEEYLEQLINTSSDDDANTNSIEEITKLLDSYESLIQSETQYELFQKQFNESKQSIRELSRREQELTIANMDEFQARSENDDVSQFSDMIERAIDQASIESAIKSASSSHGSSVSFLRNASFILKNPTAPIPDENEENDDLAVEGGIVDLKCPVTLQYYKDPFISKKCGHVFDKAAIDTTFSNASNCPIPGCPKTLRLNDFERDRVMLLRVKVWEKMEVERNKRERENYVRL